MVYQCRTIFTSRKVENLFLSVSFFWCALKKFVFGDKLLLPKSKNKYMQDFDNVLK